METISIPASLENDQVILLPLQEADFERLYAVASDPEIWAQHPNKDRWQKEVFKVFFQGAMESKGAFKIIDKGSQDVVGSTRFYDYNAAADSIFIGYTFYARSCWGKGINQAVKKMMLDYVFRFVSKVNFHIGAENVRSQIAIDRLGARKVAEEEVAYFGEPDRLNFVYELQKEDWDKKWEYE
ncbi:MAG: N-acetyltransferase [Sphingobacteriales bacterium]|nr:MAG: N-acetyltransferase [Sphingobacteriales bacterium]